MTVMQLIKESIDELNKLGKYLSNKDDYDGAMMVMNAKISLSQIIESNK